MGDDTGSHAGKRKKGANAFYNPQHSAGDSGYVGKHASDRRGRLGRAYKAVRNAVRAGG